jgi:uncharacterized cofD-like protein
MSRFEALVDPLLDEMGIDFEGLHVVCLGGGHGLAQALLAVQEYADVITAVVSVADDGGSSGRLAPAFDLPPPGDSRKALLALSPSETLWYRLMEHRFEGGDVAGHSMGNLILTALAQLSGGLEDALHTAGRLLGARGAVVPAAAIPLRLEATVGGRLVAGQAAISRSRGGIEELRVLPEDARATRLATDAIASADQIVIGPGSLFTSLVADLKVPGIVEAVNASEGTLTYIGNLTTQDGETLGLDLAAHLAALTHHTGMRMPDTVVAHHGALPVPEGLEAVSVAHDEVERMGCRLEAADLADAGADWPQHDPARLGAVLRRLA